MLNRTALYGIDFSASVHAGQYIWIAHGVPYQQGIQVLSCMSAARLPDSGKERGRCLSALADWIAEQNNAIIGLDFPFSLPEPLLWSDNWDDLILALSKRHSNPQAFRAWCRQQSGDREWKRKTDIEQKAPFSPYNLRIYRQTYHGLSDLLAPLIKERRITVFPMQPIHPEKPIVIEICPASTLKRLGLYGPYKSINSSDPRQHGRIHIVTALEKTGHLAFASDAIRHTVLQDRLGNALDSVLALYGVLQFINHTPQFNQLQADYFREGFTFC